MLRFLVWVPIVGIVFSWQVIVGRESLRADEPVSSIAAFLEGGEYSLARARATSLPALERDAALAEIVQTQLTSGERAAAGVTLRGIADPESRRRASRIDGDRGDASEGRGGGSQANFGPLIQLIQTTIRPDTWEALGGPSAISPYAQGILVDPRGTVRDVEHLETRDAGAVLDLLLGPGDEPIVFGAAPKPGDWRRPANLRVVSLRRLRDEIARRQLLAMPLGESCIYLAGLSDISHVALVGDDVLVAGPVGGIQSRLGWLVDARTGQHPLRLDFFSTAARAAISNQLFGCTIDPSPEGLQRAQQLAASVQSGRTPMAVAAQQMGTALGKQRVEVFGTDARTPLALLLVEADRHMKRIALGDEEMPNGVRNYLDFVDELIDQGGPADVLIRLWFTANPQQVQADASRQVFRLSGRPLRLSGQNERSLAQGRARVADDPCTVAMVDEFNRRFEAIRSKYPIYGALESLYRAAAIAELVNRFGQGDAIHPLLESIADLELFSSSPGIAMTALVSVDSIVIMHTTRVGRKQHHVLLASGGVLVDTGKSLQSRVETYPTLASTRATLQHQPIVVNRWWWNATASSEYPASR